MNAQTIREFRLSPPGSNRGISCDANGAFVGSVPLLKRARVNGKEVWEPRDCGDLSKQLGGQFGLPVDFSSKIGGLKAISNALNEGDVTRAQIATVLLGIPDPPPLMKGARSRSEMIKFIRDLHWSGILELEQDSGPTAVLLSNSISSAEPAREIVLVKAGYNSDEPRDGRGRWTNGDGSDDNVAHTDATTSSGEASLSSAVYHPGVDPVELDEVGDPKQLLLSQLQHRLQVLNEMEQWRKKGFFVMPNVTFVNPMTGTPVIADFVVSRWVPDPEGFFLFRMLQPFLVRDVKTGAGGQTDNQKEVYPHIKAGGEVIPVGDNAAWAGFDVGEPTVIAEIYVGPDGPSFTVH